MNERRERREEDLGDVGKRLLGSRLLRYIVCEDEIKRQSGGVFIAVGYSECRAEGVTDSCYR
jgi:hypothetical protein